MIEGHPRSPESDKNLETKGEEATIPVGEGFLKGMLFFPPVRTEPMPAVLYIHGWMGRENSYRMIAQELAKRGIAGLTVSLEGHGQSSGKLNEVTRSDHVKDAVAAYDFLAKQQGIDPSHIGALGASYGCYVLGLLSKERPLHSLAFRAPATYPNDKFDEPLKQIMDTPELTDFRNRAVRPEESKSLEALAQFTGDLLIVESEKDEYIPHQTIQNYLDAARSAKQIKHLSLAGVDHAVKNQHHRPRVNALLERWLEKELRTPDKKG